MPQYRVGDLIHGVPSDRGMSPSLQVFGRRNAIHAYGTIVAKWGFEVSRPL